MDALLFYVFFEGMLIPMFIIIGIWGGARRVYATLKFFLYTFFGSIFMLVALIYLYLHANSWEMADMAKLPLSASVQAWLFFAFLAGFSIKVPMWPVHTWLPDAHVEAPTGGSVILAAIMLKIGGYGFIRFSLPITPDASQEYAWVVIAMSLIAVIYIGFVALVQEDMKKLIAYSSVAHMGFVTLACSSVPRSCATAAQPGRVSQRVWRDGADDLAWLHFRRDVRQRRRHLRPHAHAHDQGLGGVVNTMPWFAAFWVLFFDGQLRSAGHERLRRRVHGHPRELPDELGAAAAVHADHRRCVHAVAGQARDLRRGRERPRRAPERHQSARNP
jgi:NADH-quinone oxidoreductase subunit M